MSSAIAKAVGGDPGMNGSAKDGETAPLIERDTRFRLASFTQALTRENGKRVPQAIGHRGYNAKFPENSMASFRGAVEVGADALETDVHLTKDGVVVLSHDPTLKRCFGLPEKIIDHDWAFISSLRTTKEPHEPLPRLADLLTYLAEPANAHLWLLLDIKMDNNSDDVMRLIASTIKEAEPAPDRPWHDRIALGIWSASFLPFCKAHLPTFPVSHITISTAAARPFLTVPNVSFNMLQFALLGPLGNSFIASAKENGRPIYAWTVNDEKKMRWGIEKGLDGIITDDPKKFLEVRKKWETGEDTEKVGFTVREWVKILQMQLLVFVFGYFIRWKLGISSSVAKEFVGKQKSQ